MPPTREWSSEELEILQNLEPFAKLPGALREATLEKWEPCKAEPGQLLLEQGQTDHTHLYVVFEGMVRMIGGTVNSRGPATQSPILGLPELLNETPSAYAALVALPTTYARLPAEYFHRLCEEDSSFSAFLRSEYRALPERAESGGHDRDVETRSPLAFLQDWYGDRPWGSVLDAGTGESSLRWVMNLPTERWVAVTGDPRWTSQLVDLFGFRFREQDKLVEHNWTDNSLLQEEKFDVVIADYLLGAIECLAPYFQEKLWSRLRPHVGQYLFVVGLEPPELCEPATDGGRMVQSFVRLRDSLMVMTGKSRFREYPLSWVEDTLPGAGFVIEATQTFPKQFDRQWIDAILDNCLRLLPDLDAPDLAVSMANHIQSHREAAMSLPETHLGIRFGQDYAVVARPV